MPQLTERQHQCLEAYLARKTAKQIGRELGITHHAVEQHLKAARKKLHAADTSEAARIYFGEVHTTGEPYYASPEVSGERRYEQFRGQPSRASFLLRDSAAEEAGLVQTLSPAQTLMAIGACGFGLISILALIVAVANGVAQLAP
jgi:DNA-binding CsgD family transcriptional regulator